MRFDLNKSLLSRELSGDTELGNEVSMQKAHRPTLFVRRHDGACMMAEILKILVHTGYSTVAAY